MDLMVRRFLHAIGPGDGEIVLLELRFYEPNLGLELFRYLATKDLPYSP